MQAMFIKLFTYLFNVFVRKQNIEKENRRHEVFGRLIHTAKKKKEGKTDKYLFLIETNKKRKNVL